MSAASLVNSYGGSVGRRRGGHSLVISLGFTQDRDKGKVEIDNSTNATYDP